MSEKIKNTDMNYMPDDTQFERDLRTRQLRGTIWRGFYILSILTAILALIVLFANVINSAFGSIATSFEVNPVEITGEDRTLADFTEEELVDVLIERKGNRLPVLVRDYLSQVPDEVYTESTLAQVIPNGNYPDGYENITINEIRDLDNTAGILGEFMQLNLPKNRLIALIEEEIIVLQVVDAWSLRDAIFNFEPSPAEQAELDAFPGRIQALEDELATVTQLISDKQAEVTALRDAGATQNADAIRALNEEISTRQADSESLTDDLEDTQKAYDRALHANITTSVEVDFADSEIPVEIIRYHSWIDGRFLQDPMSSVPAQAGIRTALMGSLIMMVIVILVSLPVGVAAAIYLEEYAKDNFLSRFPLFNINQLIETNVRNLAGVPSIIYGMLGLAIFVRMLAPVTSGVAFGFNAEPPPVDRIVEYMLELESLAIESLEINDNYQVTAYTGSEAITEAQMQGMVTTFRRLGTPSITNSGNISLERAEEELASLFNIRIVNDIPANADAIDYTRIAAGYVELDTMPLTVEQFEALAGQLRRITSFTINGRTILSAALTLSLLILPVIVINAQEALRAVPNALREASFGLGATKWQTIWRTVLPSAIPGIMTGTILAVSRAVGETAPLIVVGASTFLLTDPTGPFSQFTVLPIQIFQWTSRPQGQFQFIAAAAIIILLSMVLVLNAVAILIRNRFEVRY